MKSFRELRPLLEKQYENVCYDPASGCSERELKSRWTAHCLECPDESRILQRAFLTGLILEHAPVAVEEFNPFAGKLCDFGMAEADLTDGYKKAETRVPGYIGWCADMKLGIGWMVDRSHVAPDWEAVLELGLPGLLERAGRGGSDFHKACVMVYEGLAAFCRRCGERNHNPVLRAVADHAPRTLHEAFQLALVFHDMIELFNEEVRTMGRFDALYCDFYRRDLAEGRLTHDSAKNLIQCFWIAFYAKYQGRRFGKNFCFGPDFNELSRLGMEAYYEMNTVDPKLSVLVREDMPRDFAEQYVRCIRDGRTGIVSLNYNVIVNGLIRHGRTAEDANHFIPIGCYEPAVAGKEISLSGATHCYLPSILLRTLFSGNDFPTFDSFLRRYRDHISESLRIMADRQILCEKAWPYINPVPLLSGTFANCVRTGKDITEGGADYNTTGCVISYLADAVDSLSAIRYLVFERKLCTVAGLKKALEANWNGYEPLRMTAKKRAPKWGNNDDRTDALAVELAKFTAESVAALENGRGGKFFPSLYGQLVTERGAALGALPSGRLAGEPCSKNVDACIGADRNGITALMNSVLKIDMTLQPCGTCLDLMIHPSAAKGPEGIENLLTVIRTFIARGGSGLQFNLFDAALLKDAQKHPENYSNLQVRVCGWNVRFTDLTPEAQQTFIDQAEGIG